MSDISSSTEHNSNRFLTPEYVESKKGIEITDEILSIINESNRVAVLDLRPVKDSVILEGTKYFQDAQNLALQYLQSEYERLILQLYDESDKTLERYHQSKVRLIKAIMAEPSEAKRSIAASASVSVQSSLLNNIQGVTDERGNFFDN